MESKSSSQNLVFPRFKTDDLKQLTSRQRIYCDLEALFNDIKVIPRSTQSESFQAFAKIKPNSLVNVLKNSHVRTVFLKIYPKSPDEIEKTGLEVERDIYAELTRLMLDGHIPNLIRYIASFDCFFDPTSAFWSNVRKLQPYVNEAVPTQVLILEQANGVTLEKWLERSIETEDLIQMCIQTIYTLQCFGEIGFRHNDLHSGNIWIEQAKFSPMFYFVDFDTYYKLDTDVFVKIFDFDLSSFDTGEDLVNEELETDFCEKYGICSNRNDKFDLFTFLYYLRYRARQHRNFPGTSFIEDMTRLTIKSPELLSDKCCAFQGRICKNVFKPVFGRPPCDPTWVPSDNEMLSPTLLLQSSLFDQYRFTLSGGDIDDLMDVFEEPPNVDALHPYYVYEQIYCLPSINKLDLLDHIRDVLFS